MAESYYGSIGLNFSMPVNGYRKSTLVLVSSLLFLIPVFVFLVNHDYLAAMCVTIACVFSVLGDYVHIGREDTQEFRNYDAISSALLFCIILTRHFLKHAYPKPENLLPKIIFPLSLLKYSSMAKTQREWEIRHSLWHVSIVLVLLSEA